MAVAAADVASDDMAVRFLYQPHDLNPERVLLSLDEQNRNDVHDKHQHQSIGKQQLWRALPMRKSADRKTDWLCFSIIIVFIMDYYHHIICFIKRSYPVIHLGPGSMFRFLLACSLDDTVSSPGRAGWSIEGASRDGQ